LPPLLFRFGTSPIRAAKCQAEWSCDGSVTVVMLAEQVIGPMPGMTT